MRIVTLMLAVLLSISLACAVENQAFLGIFAETTSMKVIGMPEIDITQIPGGLENLGPAMGMLGGSQRKLFVRLWSPSIAPKEAFATLAIPKGLKLGKELKLALYRPEPDKGTPGGTTGGPGTGGIPDFTMKRYWGSSATVRPGQPEVFSTKDLKPEERARMQAEMKSSGDGGSYYYKPNWTTGYWPHGQQTGIVKGDAVMEGLYALTTNYTGNVSIEVPKEVNFLAPITFTSPKLDKAPPLDKAITFKWTPVPGILGYYAQIVGMQGKNTVITWTSSEIRTEPDMDADFLQMAQVKEYVKATKFMAPDRVEVIVPIGIFKDCDTVFFSMVGYGPGTALAEGQPLPRVQTKTTISMSLKGLGGFEAGIDDELDDGGDE